MVNIRCKFLSLSFPKFDRTWTSLKRKDSYREGARAKDNEILTLKEDKLMRYRQFDPKNVQQMQYQAMFRVNIDGCFRTATLRELDLRSYKREEVDIDGVRRARCSISCTKNKSHQDGGTTFVILKELTACFSCGCPIGEPHNANHFVSFFNQLFRVRLVRSLVWMPTLTIVVGSIRR